jgi:sugar O-acyltransferase (sialic acid O-acetyltransferase NeuD family)
LYLGIYCAGNLGREVREIASRENFIKKIYKGIFFIDDTNSLDGSIIDGTRVFKFKDIKNDTNIIIANGEPKHRESLLERVRSAKFNLGKITDNTTIISDFSFIDYGVILCPNTSVSSGAKIGMNVLINNSSIIGHDVEIGINSVVSSMVNLGGSSKVGDNSYVGMGSQIKEGVTIGDNVIIGMGSIVTSDIPNNVIAMGYPAKVLKENISRSIFKNKGEL